MSSGTFKHKSVKHIEWTVYPGSYYNNSVFSVNFTLQNSECKFQFHSGMNRNEEASLYFKCENELTPSVRITIYVATDTSHISSEIKTITSTDQKIWSYSNSWVMKHTLTFNVTFHTDFPKDDKSIQTPPYIDTRFLLERTSKDFVKLLDDGANHDVEFICGDQTIKAHKNVLSCRSNVFASMLQSDMIEGQTGRVEIQDMDATFFQQFLRCLYTGMLLELTVDTAVQLYIASDKYAVDTLKQQCAEFLRDNLSLENACHILILADRINDSDLKNGVIEYICKKKIPVVLGEKWADFCIENQKLAIEVLNLFCNHLCEK